MKQLYTIVENATHVAKFTEELTHASEVAFDLETTGLDWFLDDIRLAQFNVNGSIFIINVDSNPKGMDYLNHFINQIQVKNKTIVSHNAKFELKFILDKVGVLLTNVYCTQTAEMILTAGKFHRQKYFSLAELVREYCNDTLDKDIRLQFIDSPVITEEMLIYSARDVLYLSQIKTLQEGEASNLDMEQVMNLEMKLLPVVAKMEYDGVGFDLDKWLAIAEDNKKKVEELEPKIVGLIVEGSWDSVKDKVTNGIDAFETYGLPVPKVRNSRVKRLDLTYLENLTSKEFIKKELLRSFNINSTKQLPIGLALCGIELPDTKASTLENYKQYEVVQAILDYREVNKQLTTYGEGWKEYVHPKTGRIHSQFNTVGTSTGRWSSDNPNLQNVPHEERFRSCFIAKDGYKLVTSDYSQAEMRFVGAVSNERKIIEAYINGEDIHAKTASVIYNKPIEEVTKEERSRGKTLNFSILYGSSAWGIAQKNADISEEEAEELLSRFFNGYPNLYKYILAKGQEVWTTRMSRTPMGRIRFFDEETLFHSNKELEKFKARIKREGFNIIIQGGSADSLKLAMIESFYNQPFSHEDYRFVLQVHDEVTVEVKEEILEAGIEYLISCMERMEQIFLGDIPAKADYVYGDCWSKE